MPRPACCLKLLLGAFLLCGLPDAAWAQIGQTLPEVDLYYKLNQNVRVWFQAKETFEAGAPVTAEIGPSLDFYLKSGRLLSEITAFDSDDSKSRPLVFSIGYRYLPYPGAPPANRMEPLFILNLPIPRLRLLASDRNRADLDWQGGAFTWQYRNRIQLERTLRIRHYHFSPYASAEFFYESQYGKWADTAIYAGSEFPLGRHFDLNPYYEHQNQTGKAPNQLYNQFGLILNLFFGP